MFRKILIANRGVIATRIIRTCREMGISPVALYTEADRGSLHVRLADQCMQVGSAADLYDGDLIVKLAKQAGADAIHPGLGFLAEEADFIRTCEDTGICFIGPPSSIVEPLRNKIVTQEKAQGAGFRTPLHSMRSYGAHDFDAVNAAAAAIGYPIIIKSCSGGRGRGERLAASPAQLPEAVRQAQAVSQAVYGSRDIYLEKAILPAYQVGVQILADKEENLIQLGDREGSILSNGMKIVEEAPVRCLEEQQRANLQSTALELARLFKLQGLGTVEFIVDVEGNFYFSEIKARIQVEHALTEMLSRLDLVREQIRMAAGLPLPAVHSDAGARGWALMARIRANDPLHDNMPSPGYLQRVRLPGGPEVRVDTYTYSHCHVPAEYDPLLANLTVWGETRELSLQRLQRALEDFSIIGTATNIPQLQAIATHPQFVDGTYTTDLRIRTQDLPAADNPQEQLRDLAAAVAILYLRKQQPLTLETPERFTGGWHSSSRRLPQ